MTTGVNRISSYEKQTGIQGEGEELLECARCLKMCVLCIYYTPHLISSCIWSEKSNPDAFKGFTSTKNIILFKNESGCVCFLQRAIREI